MVYCICLNFFIRKKSHFQKQNQLLPALSKLRFYTKTTISTHNENQKIKLRRKNHRIVYRKLIFLTINTKVNDKVYLWVSITCKRAKIKQQFFFYDYLRKIHWWQPMVTYHGKHFSSFRENSNFIFHIFHLYQTNSNYILLLL